MKVSIGPTEKLIPGPEIPAATAPMRSNNNLDVISADGTTWLAWRTAPSHFASPRARIEVISRPAEENGICWRHETSIEMGRDLREPRFLKFGNRLHLYFFEAGTNPAKFEPGRIFVSTRDLPTGSWSEPYPISEPGWVVWRVARLGDLAYMSVYGGGEKIFSPVPKPTRVELWKSCSGTDWEMLALLHVGGTETEFTELDDSSLLALTRVEGPFGKWGTTLIRTPKGYLMNPTDPDAHEIRHHREKLDSPLMFHSLGRLLVIARRQPAFGGRYDLGLKMIPAPYRTRLFQLVYWLTPKRTAVYEVDPESLDITHLADLPSRGDTCFPALIRIGEGNCHGRESFEVYNYSSPIDGADLPWLAGQLRPTSIYVTRLDVSD